MSVAARCPCHTTDPRSAACPAAADTRYTRNMSCQILKRQCPGISVLVYFLYAITTELTFEEFYLLDSEEVLHSQTQTRVLLYCMLHIRS